ncbi:MAG: hypothetical protein ACE5JD_03465 [Candidatus Methylomirabilia bacterium]
MQLGSAPPGFDPDPTALVVLILSATATAYQALASHRLPQRGVEAPWTRRQLNGVRQLAAELLGLSADFQGIQHFLHASGHQNLRQLEFKHGSASLAFRNESELAQYIKLMDRLLKRYSAILRGTYRVLRALGGRPRSVSEAIVRQVREAGHALNEAQFDSPNVEAAITNAQRALVRTHEILMAIAQEYGET